MQKMCGRILGLAVCLWAAAASLADAATLLTESQARAKAIRILKGNPYGKTPKDVSANIKEVQLITSGIEQCDHEPTTKPVWQFHIVVPKERLPPDIEPIDGYLLLDARTGKMDCAGLPLLD